MANSPTPPNEPHRSEPHRSVPPMPIGAKHSNKKAERSQFDEAWSFVRAILAPIASLKFTVVLFAMAIFIVLAGTLGQTEADIWQVVDHYFRRPANINSIIDQPFGWFHALFAEIKFKIFFPQSFFPEMPKFAWLENHFYFPNGWFIGALMFVNLLSAHIVRFRMQASGPRLAAGCIVLLLGGLVTYAVIHSGALGDEAGVQDAAWLSWETIWTLTRLLLAALWLAVAVIVLRMDPAKSKLRTGLLVGEAVAAIALVWLFIAGNDFLVGDSSVRILGQLIKATFAGLVLLGGCVLVFKQRAGIVLLHAGIGLMMSSELLVGLSAVESQLSAQEGQSKNYSEDMRVAELAVVDASAADTDNVVTVDEATLKRNDVVSNDALPFDVKLIEYFPNAINLRRAAADDKNPATAGSGLQWVPVPQERTVGTDTSQKFDVPAAYVEFITKGENPKSLGVYLLATIQMMHWKETDQIAERIKVGEKTYDVSLRFKRIYRPFWLEVLDARQDNYTGTSMARNFSSDVRIIDAEGKELLKTRIWMNNPLRYNGETYYQSEFRPKGSPGATADFTSLQVVTNKGWMIPYVSCMIVGVGMIYQFGFSLLRFTRRQLRANAPKLASDGIPYATVAEDSRFANKPTTPDRRKQRGNFEINPAEQPSKLRLYIPLGITALAAIYAISTAARPLPKYEGMNLEAAGRIPVMEGGRCKPLDTVARSTLRMLSKRETFIDSENVKRPAIHWLLDVAVGVKQADQHRIFRIENFDVQNALGISRRQGFLYSAEEVNKGRQAFGAEYLKADEARERDPKNLTVAQRQILDFGEKLFIYDKLVGSFRADLEIPKPAVPGNEADLNRVRQEITKVVAPLEQLIGKQRQLEVRGAPLVIPTHNEAGIEEHEKEPWTTYLGGQLDALINSLNAPELAAKVEAKQTSPAVGYWTDLLAAYRNADSDRFNDSVKAYRSYLDENAPLVYQSRRVNFESFFNRAEPFYVASWLYLGVFLLAIGGLLGLNVREDTNQRTQTFWVQLSRTLSALSTPLNRAAFWLAAFTIALHTVALISRIYISGRPPVTTLYSSAVFIGWGGVILALAMESIYKLGLGNLLAGIMGSGTLLIAHFLALDGDTFPMLVAVLDTQFWLATHVVTVTAGYAATFVAGILGVLYVVLGVCTPSLDSRNSSVLARMIYGSLCFAIFFSFVGTVLGGLWADDSWGRFWGWDPKENGALIIVLWNALVLHARWDGWVKDRGMAVLAMVGNIVTAWSWFGVNNLGVGLHSYGKSEEMIFWLLVFWVTQFAIVGVGLLPKNLWWSFREQGNTKGAKQLP